MRGKAKISATPTLYRVSLDRYYLCVRVHSDRGFFVIRESLDTAVAALCKSYNPTLHRSAKKYRLRKKMPTT